MAELEKGTPIAWVESRRGVTIGVSQLHRVFEDGRTYCLMPLPDDKHRFEAPLNGLTTCWRCAQLYEKAPSFNEVLSHSTAGVHA